MSGPEAGVIFVRFRVTNAGPFKAVDLQLEKRGLIRMSGRNGEGKSTIFHLMTQTAHGSNPNKSTKTELDYIGEDLSDFLLELTFRKNGSIYTAAHAVKSKTVGPHGKKYNTGTYLFRDGNNLSDENESEEVVKNKTKHGKIDTQKLIRQTLGWSLEEWFGYVYLAQKSTHTLIEGTRSARQTYLSAIFNLAPLDVLHAHYSKKSTDLQLELEGLESDRAVLATHFAHLGTRTLESLLAQIQEMDETHKVLGEQLQAFQTKQQKFARRGVVETQLDQMPDTEMGSEIETKLTGLRVLQADFESNAKLKRTLQAQLTSLPKEAPVEIPADYEQVLAYPDQDGPKLRQELAALESAQETLREKPTPVKPVIPEDYEAVLKSPDIQYSKVTRRYREIAERKPPPKVEKVLPEQLVQQRTKLQEVLSEKAVLAAEIKTLKFQEPKCPTCGTELDCADREGQLTAKTEELTQLEGLRAKIQEKLAGLEADDAAWRQYDAGGPDLSHELPEMKASLLLYEQKLTYVKLQQDQLDYTRFETTLATLSAIPALETQVKQFDAKLRYRKLGEAVERFKLYEKTRDQLTASVEAVPVVEDQASTIQQLQMDLAQAKKREVLEAEYIALKAATDQTGKISEVQAEMAELQGQRGSILRETEEVKRLNSAIQELQVKIQELEGKSSKQKLYAILAKGYGKAGQLRERQLSKFSKYLEQALLGHTIKQFPSHRFKIVVDDGIDILTSKNGGKFYDVCNMSGGEKGDLSVAFLFTLDDLLPPSRRSSLKICDEVESHFDKDRQKDFIQHTLPALKKRAETVIMISHSAAAQYGSFDAIWEVRDGKITETKAELREFEEEVAAAAGT